MLTDGVIIGQCDRLPQLSHPKHIKYSRILAMDFLVGHVELAKYLRILTMWVHKMPWLNNKMLIHIQQT